MSATSTLLVIDINSMYTHTPKVGDTNGHLFQKCINMGKKRDYVLDNFMLPVNVLWRAENLPSSLPHQFFGKLTFKLQPKVACLWQKKISKIYSYITFYSRDLWWVLMIVYWWYLSGEVLKKIARVSYTKKGLALTLSWSNEAQYVIVCGTWHIHIFWGNSSTKVYRGRSEPITWILLSYFYHSTWHPSNCRTSS